MLDYNPAKMFGGSARGTLMPFVITFSVLAFHCWHVADSWSSKQAVVERHQYREHTHETCQSCTHEKNCNILSINRRDALNFVPKNIFIAAAMVSFPSVCSARNMPKVSRDVDTSRTGTIETLIPVFQLRASLEKLSLKIIDSSSPISSSSSVLSGIDIPTKEDKFKGIFDAYSDPVSYKQKFVDQNAFLVYYTQGFDGPGRPSIESDLPVRQTLQYGARNDAWVAWDDFLAELQAADTETVVDKKEVINLLQKTISVVDAYLDLAPPDDLKKAKSLSASSS